MLRLLFLVCSILPFLIESATIEGALHIPPEYKQKFQDKQQLQDLFFKDVVIHLEGSPGTSKIAYPISTSGSFSFYNVIPGNSYILTAESSRMRYKPVRVDVNKNGNIRAREASRINTSKVTVLPSPVRLTPLGTPNFFHARQKIDIIGMVMGNPMILLMVFSCGLMFLMPKMVDMNDPEMKKELENNMLFGGKKGGNAAAQPQLPDAAEFMSNFFGGGAKMPAASKKKK